MSRPSMFRVWDKQHGCWFDTGQNDLSITLDRSVWACYEDGDWIDVSQTVVLEQFTGLYDRDGSEVYEADILTVRIGKGRGADTVSTRYVAEWSDESARFFFRAVRSDLGTASASKISNCGRVIGNIHETPELLETAR